MLSRHKPSLHLSCNNGFKSKLQSALNTFVCGGYTVHVMSVILSLRNNV